MAESGGDAAHGGDAGKKPTRIWLDGCFDLYHFGHANAIRQAKLAGDVLVVGVHNDDEVERCKGLPVMTFEERLAVVRANKWADEIVPNAPYVTSLKVLEENNIDYAVHGEDISTDENGKDSFTEVKDAGKFRLIKRTDGVSTTDIVSRMLLMTKSHLRGGDDEPTVKAIRDWRDDTSIRKFLATSRKLVQFSSGKAPMPDDKVVYVDGAFDLFHYGHVNLFKKAREFGTFLIVGVHDDEAVNARKGINYPIMNLHERVLTVMSCKYVDEVIIGSPYHITKEMVDTLKISVVLHGDDEMEVLEDEEDPYQAVKDLGLYQTVPHTPGISTSDIITRIIERRLQYETRNKAKKVKDKKIKPAAVPLEVLKDA